jgi:L-rhamnose mutarotase
VVLGRQITTHGLHEPAYPLGYVEVPGTFDEARAAMDAEPVNARWQALMAPFFEGSGRPADRLMQPLEEVFHLEADLDADLDAGPGPPGG